MVNTIERKNATTEDLIRAYFLQEYGNLTNFEIEKTSNHVITCYDGEIVLDELRILTT